MNYAYPNYWELIEQKIRKLEENQEHLAQENQQLREQLEQLKPIHIEQINYKIQELVVKELSGTLNIGLSGLSDPEELANMLSTETDANETEIRLHDLVQGHHENSITDNRENEND